MDFHGLDRKSLQELCKKHGIPANLKSLDMADRLSSILLKEEMHETKGRRGKSCFKSVSEVVEEVECEKVVVGSKGKGVKKVRFSPESDNQMFLFERTDPRAIRLLARKKRAFVKSRGKGNPVVVSGNSEESERLVGVSDELGTVAEAVVKRSLRSRTVVISEVAAFVSENDENVVKVAEKEGNLGRNLRSRRGVVVQESVEVMSKVENVVEDRKLRNSRSSAVQTKDMGLESENVDNVEKVATEKGNLDLKLRSKRCKMKQDSVEAMAVLSPCGGRSDENVNKPVEVGNLKRSLRTRGIGKVNDVESGPLLSPCEENIAKRGKKDKGIVEVGCSGVDDVTKPVEGEKMGRSLRSQGGTEKGNGVGIALVLPPCEEKKVKKGKGIVEVSGRGVENVDKPVEGGNRKRSLRSQGGIEKENGVGEALPSSPCEEKKAKRGRKGKDVVEVGGGDDGSVDKPVEGGNLKRSLRSRGGIEKENGVGEASLLSPQVKKTKWGRKGKGIVKAGDSDGDGGSVVKPVEGGNLKRSLRSRGGIEKENNIGEALLLSPSEEKKAKRGGKGKGIVEIAGGDGGNVDNPVEGGNPKRSLRSRGGIEKENGIGEALLLSPSEEKKATRGRKGKGIVEVGDSDGGNADKPVEGGNLKRSLRSRGGLENGVGEASVMSSCEEKKAKRGRKDKVIVEEGNGEGVDKSQNDMVNCEGNSGRVTRKQMRSKEVIAVKSRSDDDSVTEALKTRVRPRKSASKTQHSPKMNVAALENKVKGTRKTWTVKHHEINGGSEVVVEKLGEGSNVDANENRESAKGSQKHDNDDHVKVPDNIRRSGRRAAKSAVDISLRHQTRHLEELIDHINEDDSERVSQPESKNPKINEQYQATEEVFVEIRTNDDGSTSSLRNTDDDEGNKVNECPELVVVVDCNTEDKNASLCSLTEQTCDAIEANHAGEEHPTGSLNEPESDMLARETLESNLNELFGPSDEEKGPENSLSRSKNDETDSQDATEKPDFAETDHVTSDEIDPSECKTTLEQSEQGEPESGMSGCEVLESNPAPDFYGPSGEKICPENALSPSQKNESDSEDVTEKPDGGETHISLLFSERYQSTEALNVQMPINDDSTLSLLPRSEDGETLETNLILEERCPEKSLSQSKKDDTDFQDANEKPDVVQGEFAPADIASDYMNPNVEGQYHQNKSPIPREQKVENLQEEQHNATQLEDCKNTETNAHDVGGSDHHSPSSLVHDGCDGVPKRAQEISVGLSAFDSNFEEEIAAVACSAVEETSNASLSAVAGQNCVGTSEPVCSSIRQSTLLDCGGSICVREEQPSSSPSDTGIMRNSEDDESNGAPELHSFEMNMTGKEEEQPSSSPSDAVIMRNSEDDESNGVPELHSVEMYMTDKEEEGFDDLSSPSMDNATGSELLHVSAVIVDKLDVRPTEQCKVSGPPEACNVIFNEADQTRPEISPGRAERGHESCSDASGQKITCFANDCNTHNLVEVDKTTLEQSDRIEESPGPDIQQSLFREDFVNSAEEGCITSAICVSESMKRNINDTSEHISSSIVHPTLLDCGESICFREEQPSSSPSETDMRNSEDNESDGVPELHNLEMNVQIKEEESSSPSKDNAMGSELLQISAIIVDKLGAQPTEQPNVSRSAETCHIIFNEADETSPEIAPGQVEHHQATRDNFTVEQKAEGYSDAVAFSPSSSHQLDVTYNTHEIKGLKSLRDDDIEDLNEARSISQISGFKIRESQSKDNIHVNLDQVTIVEDPETVKYCAGLSDENRGFKSVTVIKEAPVNAELYVETLGNTSNVVPLHQSTDIDGDKYTFQEDDVIRPPCDNKEGASLRLTEAQNDNSSVEEQELAHNSNDFGYDWQQLFSEADMFNANENKDLKSKNDGDDEDLKETCSTSRLAGSKVDASLTGLEIDDNEGQSKFDMDVGGDHMAVLLLNEDPETGKCSPQNLITDLPDSVLSIELPKEENIESTQYLKETCSTSQVTGSKVDASLRGQEIDDNEGQIKVDMDVEGDHVAVSLLNVDWKTVKGSPQKLNTDLPVLVSSVELLKEEDIESNQIPSSSSLPLTMPYNMNVSKECDTEKESEMSSPTSTNHGCSTLSLMQMTDDNNEVKEELVSTPLINVQGTSNDNFESNLDRIESPEDVKETDYKTVCSNVRLMGEQEEVNRSMGKCDIVYGESGEGETPTEEKLEVVREANLAAMVQSPSIVKESTPPNLSPATLHKSMEDVNSIRTVTHTGLRDEVSDSGGEMSKLKSDSFCLPTGVVGEPAVLSGSMEKCREICRESITDDVACSENRSMVDSKTYIHKSAYKESNSIDFEDDLMSFGKEKCVESDKVSRVTECSVGGQHYSSLPDTKSNELQFDHCSNNSSADMSIILEMMERDISEMFPAEESTSFLPDAETDHKLDNLFDNQFPQDNDSSKHRQDESEAKQLVGWSSEKEMNQETPSMTPFNPRDESISGQNQISLSSRKDIHITETNEDVDVAEELYPLNESEKKASEMEESTNSEGCQEEEMETSMDGAVMDHDYTVSEDENRGRLYGETDNDITESMIEEQVDFRDTIQDDACEVETYQLASERLENLDDSAHDIPKASDFGNDTHYEKSFNGGEESMYAGSSRRRQEITNEDCTEVDDVEEVDCMTAAMVSTAHEKDAQHVPESDATDDKMSVRRRNRRNVLIHGTPKKAPVPTTSMEENMTDSKRTRMVHATTTKPGIKTKVVPNKRWR